MTKNNDEALVRNSECRIAENSMLMSWLSDFAKEQQQQNKVEYGCRSDCIINTLTLRKPQLRYGPRLFMKNRM